MKRCSRCSVEKPLDEFHRGSTASGTSHHAYCKPCLKEYGKEWRDRERRIALLGERRRAQRDRRSLREQMLDAYGPVCACCGETERRFLTLDHIDGSGADERARHGGNHQNLRHLRRNGWPTKNHRVLCFNCNCGRQHNGGVCPHEEQRGK